MLKFLKLIFKCLYNLHSIDSVELIGAILRDCEEKMNKNEEFPFTYKYSNAKQCKKCYKISSDDIQVQNVFMIYLEPTKESKVHFKDLFHNQYEKVVEEEDEDFICPKCETKNAGYILFPSVLHWSQNLLVQIQRTHYCEKTKISSRLDTKVVVEYQLVFKNMPKGKVYNLCGMVAQSPYKKKTIDKGHYVA